MNTMKQQRSFTHMVSQDEI